MTKPPYRARQEVAEPPSDMDELLGEPGPAIEVDEQSLADAVALQRVEAKTDWRDMTSAPKTRSIFVTSDPETEGVLACWRTTRIKVSGQKGWQTVSFWSAVLTRRALDFVPTYWRESITGAALEHALEMERKEAAAREAMLAKQAAVEEAA